MKAATITDEMTPDALSPAAWEHLYIKSVADLLFHGITVKQDIHKLGDLPYTISAERIQYDGTYLVCGGRGEEDFQAVDSPLAAAELYVYLLERAMIWNKKINLR